MDTSGISDLVSQERIRSQSKMENGLGLKSTGYHFSDQVCSLKIVREQCCPGRKIPVFIHL